MSTYTKFLIENAEAISSDRNPTEPINSARFANKRDKTNQLKRNLY